MANSSRRSSAFCRHLCSEPSRTIRARSRTHVSSSKSFTFRPSAFTSFGDGGRRAPFAFEDDMVLDGRERALRVGPGPLGEGVVEEGGSPTIRSKISLSPKSSAFCAIIQCSAVGKYTSRSSPSLTPSPSPFSRGAGRVTRTVKGEGYH